jgi:hypothetical protein
MTIKRIMFRAALIETRRNNSENNSLGNRAVKKK